MVECHPSTMSSSSASAPDQDAPCNLTSCQEDRIILSLLLRQNEVKDRLVHIMQKLYKVKARFETESCILHAYILIVCINLQMHAFSLVRQGTQNKAAKKTVSKSRLATESDHSSKKNILVGLNPQTPSGAPTSKAFLDFG